MTALSKASFARQLSRLLPKLTKQSTLYLAYSGGVDSAVLLNLTAQYAQHNGLQLKALHVNHGVSTHALKWQSFCEQQCTQWKIECLVKVLDLSIVKANFEQVARDERYTFFAQHLQLGDVLLTAHHQSDQIETVLMRLFRGSGVRGLVGIVPVKHFKEAQLVRPFLDVGKQNLVDYATNNQIDWVEDESNQAPQFDRNLLRHSVMPALRAAFPESEAGIMAAANKAQVAQVLLDELGEMDISHCKDEGQFGWFDLAVPLGWSKLRELSDQRVYNVIDVWMQSHVHYALPRSRLLTWVEQLRAVSNESQPSLEHEGGRLQYAYGYLHFLKELLPAQAESIYWNILEPLCLPELGLELTSELTVMASGVSNVIQLEHDEVEVSWRKGGERIRQVGRDHSQSFKKCLQENAVPHWEREHLPILKIADNIVWTAALGALDYSLLTKNGKLINFALRKLN
ncbi:MAG: tRNA(Ile)-lysidine synthase [Saprospiraceae bacterium]